MLVAKQIADLLTFLRLLMAVLLPWLGMAAGKSGLPTAAWILLLSWTSDVLDGPIARRSRVKYSSWIGNHDLEVDMAVCTGLLFFFLLAGFAHPLIGLLYLLGWGLYFWRRGIERSPGMLYQAAPYAFLIYLCLRYSTPQGVVLLSWITILVVITWPRFPQEVIPEFLQGMRSVFSRKP